MVPSVVASVDQTVVQVVENSCEKSCQVTSELIKADMKAATENTKRNSCKGITSVAGENTARAGANSGTVWGTGNSGGAARTGVKPVTVTVGRVAPGIATSRQAGGCGSVVAGTTHRATTTDMAVDNTEEPSEAQSSHTCTRESMARQSSEPAYMDSLDSTGAAGNSAPSRPAQLTGQGERWSDSVGSASAGSASAAASSSQQDYKVFVPRRPLTRSCTRLSSVSLVPETGKICFTNTESLCSLTITVTLICDFILLHMNFSGHIYLCFPCSSGNPGRIVLHTIQLY